MCEREPRHALHPTAADVGPNADQLPGLARRRSIVAVDVLVGLGLGVASLGWNNAFRAAPPRPGSPRRVGDLTSLTVSDLGKLSVCPKLVVPLHIDLAASRMTVPLVDQPPLRQLLHRSNG